MPRSWKTPRKILCATDLIPSSDRALDLAIQLAGEWKASLLLVHIDRLALSVNFAIGPPPVIGKRLRCEDSITGQGDYERGWVPGSPLRGSRRDGLP